MRRLLFIGLSWLLLGPALLLAVPGVPSKLRTMASVYRQDGIEAVYYRAKSYLPGSRPNVRWEATSPEAVGLIGDSLFALAESMAKQRTRALLIAKDGLIVLEWYADSYGPNRRQSLAAMAKGVVGSPLLLTAIGRGEVGLEDRAHEYIPSWKEDSRRSQVTVRQLLSHSAGVEEVDFLTPHTGWKKDYFENPERRFRMALHTAPIIFSPGTRTDYSGVAYYVLAYILGTAFDGKEPGDIRSLLRDGLMRPLGVPTEDWRLSYEQSYEVDGMTLRAIGSGASYTPRAAARVGELLLRRGEWLGVQLIPTDLVDQALRYAQSPAQPDPAWDGPHPGFGWWTNADGFFPSLPLDAAVAAGVDHQLLLLVPSQHLLALRLGGPLGEPGEQEWSAAEREFFAPLMSAVTATPGRLGVD